MSRDEITVQYPTYDTTDSVGSVKVTKTTVTQANGIKINNAYAGKDNSLKIVINNTYSTTDSVLTIKAGEKQNKSLGDSLVALVKSAETVVTPIRDAARYENNDGSIYLDFSTGFTGTIYAVAEKAGL